MRTQQPGITHREAATVIWDGHQLLPALFSGFGLSYLSVDHDPLYYLGTVGPDDYNNA